MSTHQTPWLVAATLVCAMIAGGCGDDSASGDEGSGSTGDTLPSSSTTASTTAGTTGGVETESDDETGTDTGIPGDVDVEFLTPVEHLVRVSMALRGLRPSLADIEAIEADPDQIGAIVDGYLESPEFGATIRGLHNESLLVTPDYFYYPAGFPPVGALASEDLYQINRSVMDAPLRLIEHVVMNDLPYSEIVTADYTLANDIVATVWGLEHGGGSGWDVTRWDDGRENAGVLSDSWLFQRHRSTASNANRGRANAVASALICADFLAIDVDVDVNIDLSDPEAVANAVLENPSCAVCHATLDPLASYFRGFNPAYVPADVAQGDPAPGYPMETPWFKELFPDVLGVPQLPPAYFGAQGDGLAFLGAQIADDPRFTDCTARRFYAYFHQTPADAVPTDIVETYADVLIDSGEQAKALARAIVLADDFRIARVVPVDAANPTDDELAYAEDFGLLKTRPTALSTMMRDLTGFEWIVDLNNVTGDDGTISLGEVPMLEDSFLGYQVLAGGIDAQYVAQPSHTYNGTTTLVLDGLAREAAHFVVEHDAAAAPNERILFSAAPSNADETVVREQLARFVRRFYGEQRAPDDGMANEVNELYDLFAAAHDAIGDPERAWKTTLTSMLQDVRVAYY